MRWARSRFKVSLVDQNREVMQTVIEHEGSGGGSTYPPEDGTYALQVAGDGDWSIRVFEMTD